MARKNDLMRRVLFINGVRVNMKNGHSPTMGLLEEIEACHIHGNPWSGFRIEEFSAVRFLTDEKGEYTKYDVRMKSQRAAVG